MMKRCCIHAFLDHGFATHFQVASVGDRLTCPTCGAMFEKLDASADDGPRWAEVKKWSEIKHKRVQ